MQTTMFNHRLSWLGLSSAVVLLCLIMIGQAELLSHPASIPGLGQRYVFPSSQLFAHWGEMFQMADSERAAYHLRYALPLLSMTALAHVVCLLLSSRCSKHLAMYGAITIWSLVALATHLMRVPSLILSVVAVVCAVLSLLSALRTQPKTHHLSIWSFTLMLAWVVLTSLSWLLIADFAARGPYGEHGIQHHGIKQMDTLVLSGFLLCMARLHSQELVRYLMRYAEVMSEMVRQSRPLWSRGALILLSIGIGLVLGWLARRVESGGFGKPHVAGELLKLICIMLTAWTLYRVVEWGQTQAKLFSPAFFCCLSCGTYYGVSGDTGPLLVLLPTIIILSIVIVKSAWHARLPLLSLALRVTLVIAFCIAWGASLVTVAPILSKLAEVRQFNAQNPYIADRADYAKTRWLIDATPTQGFGLGRIPYCGVKAHFQSHKCTLESGLNKQVVVDMALVLPYASYGKLITLAILFGIGLSLLLLPFCVSKNASPQNVFLRWIVTAGSCLSLVQLITCIASVSGWIALVGITTPFLSFGTVALTMLALLFAIASHPSQ